MTKLSIKASALHTVLTDAARFASPEADNVPAISAVRIEANGTSLVAAATDRFTLGASRAECEGDEMAVTLTLRDVKTIIKLAKTLRRDEASREATLSTDIDGGAVTVQFSTGESVTVNQSSGDFPRWRQLLPATADANAYSGVVTVDPARLAPFTAVRGGKGDMRLFPRRTAEGTLQPIVVTVGDDFVGLLMPLRVPGTFPSDIYAAPAWL